jgi:hypothetical protein
MICKDRQDALEEEVDRMSANVMEMAVVVGRCRLSG